MSGQRLDGSNYNLNFIQSFLVEHLGGLLFWSIIIIFNVKSNKKHGFSSMNLINFFAVCVLLASFLLSLYTLKLHHDVKKSDRFYEQLKR